ncbi:hypothetical protein HPB51_011223 [Rhipicephalus microplus]|uniref:Nose resistant-to-fluoxetine protein N-terminal domain-containing protein n=1 Tax=Rhipicephalus microplus TaxID=6941 RepID=A0A9J6F1Y8_RHIMP|nr:hypothetical protein HPB51_011223 [Rhipicephalus microplus]
MDTVAGVRVRGTTQRELLSAAGDGVRRASRPELRCRRRSRRHNRSARNPEILDATGKFPSGILEGTTGDLGAYDECLASRLEPTSGDRTSLSSRGQYCSVFLKPKQSRAMDKLIAQLTRYPVIKKRFNLTMARKAIKKGRVRGLRFGLCVPSSCSAAEVEAILASLAQLISLTSALTSCRTDESNELNGTQVAFIVIYSTLTICVLLGTIVDVLERLKKKETTLLHKDKDSGKWVAAWKAFSAVRNTESLLKKTPPEHECLKCLNGMRFFTALWVILGHSYNILDPHILERNNEKDEELSLTRLTKRPTRCCFLSVFEYDLSLDVATLVEVLGPAT